MFFSCGGVFLSEVGVPVEFTAPGRLTRRRTSRIVFFLFFPGPVPGPDRAPLYWKLSNVVVVVCGGINQIYHMWLTSTCIDFL